MPPKSTSLLFALALVLISPVIYSQQQPVNMRGSLQRNVLTSAILRDNHVGLIADRNVIVYLPPGYATSGKRYPVVYYLHSIGTSASQQVTNTPLVTLLERGFASKIINDIILVVADYSAGGAGCFYENSPVSGRWLDFTTEELVPYIDKNFRTLPHRDSRAVVGDFIGGRGVLKMAMQHASLFGVAYAIHPVATGRGYMPWTEVAMDWKRIYAAQSFADLKGDGRAIFFVTLCQGFLPNPSRPPFYCDFFMEFNKGELKPLVDNMLKAKKDFHLEERLVESAPALRTMRGLAFDWGRFDTNQDHVYANREFSRRLEDLDVAHEAEEYRGNAHNKNWTEDGRFYNRVLPFLQQHLAFEPAGK